MAAMASITVTLPDGSPLELDEGASGADAAASIGPGLAKAALAIRVGEETRDLGAPLADGEAIEIVTAKSDGALDLIRHDAAHVMATAVCELYPGTKVSIGPPIDGGFYYDFEFPEGVTVTDADLERIEAKMAEHIAADEHFERADIGVDEALDRFRAEDQPYKVELIEDLVANEGVETVSLYRNGPFTDLCRGPHAPSTGRIKAVKLNSLAGAYWRGDETRQMLTRIYGTAFFSKQDLAEHIERIEQAKARDHRRLGPQLDLFMFREESPGMPFWLPQGTVLLKLIRAKVDEQLAKRGYVEIRTPEVMDVDLWHRSGHYENYRENMYFAEPSDKRSRGGRPPLRPEADELPGRLSRLRLLPPLLPRPAAAAGRVRQRLALRARGRPARPPPRPRLHPGRRPRLLHARADRPRGHRRLSRRSTSSTRRSGSKTSPSSSRPDPRSRSAPTSSGRPPRRGSLRRSTSIGRDLQPQPRRRRLLRSEDRLPRDRRARPLLAARHLPARLHDAGPLRARLTRAPTTRTTGR